MDQVERQRSHIAHSRTDHNRTYTATFRTRYSLTMSRGTGGTVLPGSGWRNSGSIVSISATPTNNTQVSYHFEAWSGTGAGSYSGTNNPASITMNGPITENASFIRDPVRVTVKTSPAGLTFSVDGTTYTSAQIFSWQLVQATRLPRLRRRTAARVLGTCGVTGAAAELFRTLLRPPLTGLTPRISIRSIS